MTTETRSDLGQFEEYVSGTMPDDLRFSGPPRSWRGTSEAWADLLAVARDAFRGRAAEAFIADLRARDRELEARRQVLTISPELAGECEQILREIRRLQAPIETRVLEEGARRAGNERTVRAALEAAQSGVASYQARLTGQRAEEAARPILRVLRRFRGPNGQSFEAGEYRVTPEQAEGLRTWATKMETYNAGRDLGSVGYPVWPVFTIETPEPT